MLVVLAVSPQSVLLTSSYRRHDTSFCWAGGGLLLSRRGDRFVDLFAVEVADPLVVLESESAMLFTSTDRRHDTSLCWALRGLSRRGLLRQDADRIVDPFAVVNAEHVQLFL